MKISIVTPTLNRCALLRQTMRSILSQRGDFQLQWIVIDGGSSDGTVPMLQSAGDPRICLSSGPDSGQTAALNKGLARADGDVVAWLNDDDLYAPGALQLVAQRLAEHPEAQWLVGRCQIINERGRIIRRGLSAYKTRHTRYFNYRALLRENMIPQPAVFWRRGFGQQVGKLDESLHYTMDYDLWLRMAYLSHPLFVDQVLACFRLYPRSKSGQVRRAQFHEQYQVACRHLNGDVMGRLAHRFNVEKIVWAYRMMRLVGY